MAGSLTIKTTPGCDPDTVTMVLSSTAEPDGGDHIATVGWGGVGNALRGLVFVEMETSPGTWVEAPTSFMFTDAAETYTLRARGVEHLADYNLQLLFDYIVNAVYAPAWAKIEDTLVASIDDTPCCVPVGEVYGTEVLHTRPLLGSNGIVTMPDCSPYTSGPYGIYTACNQFTITDTVDVACGTGIYGWFDLSHTFVLSITHTQACNSIGATGTVTCTAVKLPGENALHLTVVTYTAVNGSVTGFEDPDSGYAPKKSSTNVPCSNFKLVLDGSFSVTCSDGGGSMSTTFQVALEYLAP